LFAITIVNMLKYKHKKLILLIMDNNKKEEKIDLENYQDRDGLTIKKMEFGLWFLKQKPNFKRIFIIFLVIISAVSWSYSIYGFSYYFAKGINDDEKMIYELVQDGVAIRDFVEKNYARNLEYSEVLIIDSSQDNKYDFLSKIKNPNKNYYSSFDYCFFSGDEDFSCSNTFILPNEEKYLFSFSNEINKKQNVGMILKNIVWNRINPHDISDWNFFKDSHVDIIIKDIKFDSSKTSGLSEKINLNLLSFFIKNNSAYNYSKVNFNILLYKGPLIIGALKYSVFDFLSEEERKININWPGNFGNPDDIEISSELNILDSESYLKHEGGIGDVK